jgi:hypothetical protein
LNISYYALAIRDSPRKLVSLPLNEDPEFNPVRQLLRCPRCNELIGALSQQCRYCHRILNTTEIRAGIERYERVQQEESARKDRRALWFAICALLGGIAVEAVQFADKLVEHTQGLLAFASSVLFYTLAVWEIWKVCAHRRARNRSTEPQGDLINYSISNWSA